MTTLDNLPRNLGNRGNLPEVGAHFHSEAINEVEQALDLYIAFEMPHAVE